jgi:energy-coupling factor transporter ATP-binding protein EcfA2
MSGDTQFGEIVLLAGPPGAGKTTVGRLAATIGPGKQAFIEGDLFWRFFVGTPEQPDLGPTLDKAKILIKAMMLAAIPYARGGYRVFTDFTVGPWAFAGFRPWLKDTPFSYIVLCPDQSTCARRAAARPEGAMPDYAPYRDLHTAFCNLGPLERHAIRDNEATAEILAARIYEGLAKGTFRVA